MYNGLIAVWKEAGYTSFDVVARMRGILHQKKIGHTGTLDPQAEGVLAVGVGLGTKTFELLPDKKKSYIAEITFGTETDTEDIWGNTVNTMEFSSSEEEIIAAAESFLGEYMQIPPMYSAKKVDGTKLYELARKGIVIERKPSRVYIYEIKLLSFSGCRAEIYVSCSAGTYIRTLCTDIARKLGTCACMSRLTRLSACGFSKKDCVTLSQLEDFAKDGSLEEKIIPIDKALECYPPVYTDGSYDKQLRNGNSFQLCEEGRQDGLYRVYSSTLGFAGIYKYCKDDIFRPEKVFYRSKEK